MRTAASRHVALLGSTTAIALVALALSACTGAADTASPSATPSPTPSPTGMIASTPSAAPTPVATPTSMPAAPVAVLTVRCGEGAPEVNAAAVRAMKDGIHFAVVGKAGWSFGVDTATVTMDIELERDRQEVVLLIPPGDATVSCSTGGKGTAIRIEDPDGWYRPADPLCGPTGTGDAGADARGTAGDPVDLARAFVGDRLQPGDVVERAGYPVEVGRVRIVRDGKVIGSLTYREDGHGGWLSETVVLCRELQQ